LYHFFDPRSRPWANAGSTNGSPGFLEAFDSDAERSDEQAGLPLALSTIQWP